MKRIGLIILFLFFCITAAALSQGSHVSMDRPEIASREFKILLKPEVFSDRIAGYQDIWANIVAVADETGAAATEADDPYREEEGEVMYLDTPANELYKQNYILRKRVEYKKGKPAAHCELMLKYRNDDLQLAAAAKVNPSSQYAAKEKMEQDINMDGKQIGSLKSTYSHSSTIKHIQVPVENSIAAYAVVFPSLKDLQAGPQAMLLPVNNRIAHECIVSPGSLEFQQGLPVKIDISLWYAPGGQVPQIAEISFHYSVKQASSETLAASESFFKELQKRLENKIEPGMTKTDFVYAGTRQ